MKKVNNNHFEPSLSKYLDDSISNVGGDEDYNVDGDDSNIDGDDYSNARGGGGGGRRGGGGGGMRMGGGGRVARLGGGGSVPRLGGGGIARSVSPVTRHTNYVRRNYNRYYGGGWGWGAYPIGVYPPVAYYYDVENPKTIKITKKGLKYLKKHPKGVNGYFLNAIKDGNSYNETKLKESLQVADFERLMSWMHGNKFIDFI